MMPQAQLDGLTIIQAEPAHSRGDNRRMAELRCRQRPAFLRPRRPAAMSAIPHPACTRGSEPGQTRGPARPGARHRHSLRASAYSQGRQPVRFAQLIQPGEHLFIMKVMPEGPRRPRLPWSPQHGVARTQYKRRGIPVVKVGATRPAPPGPGPS